MDLMSVSRGYRVSRLPKNKITKEQTLLLNAWATFNEPNGFLPIQFLEHALNIKFNTFDAYSALFDNN